jgi:23S rRNA G2069 N7-methylase RlmK/C1962 C5-methylase RlmI
MVQNEASATVGQVGTTRPRRTFQKIIFSAAQDAGRRVSFVRRLTAAPDHPVSLFCPEGEYLKGFLLEVR